MGGRLPTQKQPQMAIAHISHSLARSISLSLSLTRWRFITATWYLAHIHALTHRCKTLFPWFDDVEGSARARQSKVEEDRTGWATDGMWIPVKQSWHAAAAISAACTRLSSAMAAWSPGSREVLSSRLVVPAGMT